MTRGFSEAQAPMTSLLTAQNNCSSCLTLAPGVERITGLVLPIWVLTVPEVKGEWYLESGKDR